MEQRTPTVTAEAPKATSAPEPRPPGALPAERLLRCPVTGAELLRSGDHLVAAGHPNRRFPIVDGVPVLLDEEQSVFRAEDFLQRRVTTMAELQPQRGRVSRLRRIARALASRIPPRTYNTADFTSDEALATVLSEIAEPSVLVIGCGDRAIEPGNGTVVYTDVSFGPLVQYICDAHSLPFEDGSFDLVIASAVLEHVVDPARCVAEIWRVLKPDGRVFAVTPFIQQVHMGRYDFTRFTYMGHRMLFRRFDTLRSGMAGGPGMALAWTLDYYLTSFSEAPTVRTVLSHLGRLLFFWLRYADRLLRHRAGAYDCASAYYFFGRRREQALPPRAVLDEHVGLNPL